MSEFDGVIKGFGKAGQFPGWATDKAMLSVEKAVSRQDKHFMNISKLLIQIARGDKITQGQYKSMMDELRGMRREDEKARKQNKQQNEDNQKDDSKFQKENIFTLKFLGDIMKKQLDAQKEGIKSAEDLNKRVEELIKQGHSEASAMRLATAEDMGGKIDFIKGVGGKFAAGLTAVVGTIAAADSFIMENINERLDFSSEIRQSGLMVGLEDAEGTLSEFSYAVNKSGFLMGEAAAFADKYSEAIGSLGMLDSLKLVKDFAYGLDGSLNLMKEYAMTFGQTTVMTGEYLETLKNLGALNQMSESQLRQGMNNFMDAVSDTSKVLKISMEESAALIKETLDEDRTKVSLGMMAAKGVPMEQVQALSDAISSSTMFGAGSEMGKMLQTRLVAGDRAQFLATEEGRAMMDNPITAKLFETIDRLAVSYESTGDPDALKNAMSELDVSSILGNMSEVDRQLLMRGEGGVSGTLLSELMSMSDRFDQIGQEAPQVTEEDYQAAYSQDMRSRRLGLTLEQSISAGLTKANLGENLKDLNQGMNKLLTELQPKMDALAEAIGGKLVGAITGLQATITDFAGDILRESNSQSLIDADDGNTNDAIGYNPSESRMYDYFVNDAAGAALWDMKSGLLAQSGLGNKEAYFNDDSARMFVDSLKMQRDNMNLSDSDFKDVLTRLLKEANSNKMAVSANARDATNAQETQFLINRINELIKTLNG